MYVCIACAKLMSGVCITCVRCVCSTCEICASGVFAQKVQIM